SPRPSACYCGAFTSPTLTRWWRCSGPGPGNFQTIVEVAPKPGDDSIPKCHPTPTQQELFRRGADPGSSQRVPWATRFLSLPRLHLDVAQVARLPGSDAQVLEVLAADLHVVGVLGDAQAEFHARHQAVDAEPPVLVGLAGTQKCGDRSLGHRFAVRFHQPA